MRQDGEPVEIPVPRKDEVIAFLTAAATTPDPDEWVRQASPPPQPRACPVCKAETIHVPYRPTRREIGDYAAYWLCQRCGTNNG
jgi:hypothetical protein